MWGSIRAQLIQPGTGLLRALREQIRAHKLIPSQARSLSGCSPARSPAPLWGSLGTPHAGMLGCPLGFRELRSSLKHMVQVQTNIARKQALFSHFPHRSRKTLVQQKDRKARVCPGNFMAQLVQDERLKSCCFCILTDHTGAMGIPWQVCKEHSRSKGDLPQHVGRFLPSLFTYTTVSLYPKTILPLLFVSILLFICLPSSHTTFYVLL